MLFRNSFIKEISQARSLNPTGVQCSLSKKISLLIHIVDPGGYTIQYLHPSVNLCERFGPKGIVPLFFYIFHFIFIDPLLICFSAWAAYLLLSFHFCLSFALCQSMPQSPVFPYVTGAHIRENNLWWPWIRDAVEFPMIRVWYGNSLKYLDRGGLSDHCSPACC